MKKLIIIVIVILVVAGGCAGGLMMLGIVRNPFAKPPAGGAAATGGGEVKPSSTYKGPTEALTWIKPPDMVIPVIANGEVRKRIYINMRLVVKTPEKKRVQDELARFESDVLQELVPYFQTYFDKKDMIDVVAIKKKLNSHGQKLYGEAFEQVLLFNVFEAGGASGTKNSFADPSE